MSSTGGSAPQGGCTDGTVGTAEGDLMEDFALQDQNGNTVRLSDYCGSVVLLEMGAMWCGVCQEYASEIPETMAEYGSQGLVILNLLAENEQGGTPSQSELTEWATTYGITTPVLADANWGVWNRYFGEATPENILVGRDGEILVLGQDARWSFRSHL
jgi:peroxiredoxin